MKTKIIPFDIELAKKIQAGEIEGKIKTHDMEDVRIICWDAYRKFYDNEIIALVKDDESDEAIGRYESDGHLVGGRDNHNNLVLEVPDNEPQFKPFEKVLVRDSDGQVWHISLYESCGNGGFYVLHGIYYKQCIPYEGNEHLIGTTGKPKEK